MKKDTLIVIQAIRQLTPSTYTIRFQKNNIQFQPGQHIGLGLIEHPYIRDYSIYSGENDDYLEVLIREVQEGDLSRKFKNCSVGSQLRMDGPFGSFTLNKNKINDRKLVFIATGTGIAPFHSFVKSYPGLNYQILHGVSTIDEAYDKDDYEKDRYVLCTSKDERGNFKGRVTNYLRANPVDTDNLYYLCGNSAMIFEVNDFLIECGVPVNHIFYEVYF